MGGYQRYEAYRDSGVEWLGEIPVHWTTGIKLIYLADASKHSFVNGPFGSDLLTSELTDAGTPVIYSGDVKEKGFSRKSDKYVTLEKAQQLNFCRVDSGDLLLAKVGDPPGEAAIYTDKVSGIVTQDVVRVRINKGTTVPNYICHLLNSKMGRYAVRLVSVEATRSRFSLGDFKSIRVVLPPLEEQKSIAHFLDYKTAQIDALIAKKASLLKKLAEKRSALISQAVTKGLDQRVPMKDSGVEWLGEISAHWELFQIKRAFTLQRGVDITKDQQTEGEIPVVSSGGIASSHNVAYAKAPGVVIGRKGTLGKVYYLEQDYWPHDTTLWVMEFYKNYPKFVYYKLLSMKLETWDTGSANPTLNRNLIHPLKTAWPPVKEQIEIVEFLQNATSAMDRQCMKVRLAIDRLKEYRTALITNAVTGAIDVRNIPIPNDLQEAI